ncbi:MAG TPA: hypothetical protein DEB40_06260 [Elusimicrobia bacterium]|nr:hypothetical protein [Elusimicrobiota bacterium]HBT61330.1 hypothetical protein [Elusimicrobiota bacterium]
MNRRIFLAVLGGLALLAVFPAEAANIRLTVLHTNDIHGWIMPRPAAFYEKDPKRPIGGAAVLAAYFRKIQGPKLLVDAGDWFLSTPEGAIRQGEGVVEVFNAVGYSALAVGNHEFDYGKKQLSRLIRTSRAPILSANIYRMDGQRDPDFRPWIVTEIGGVRVGLFGLITDRMNRLSFLENIEGLAFRRPIDEAKAAVAALRRQGATVIIALSHLGLEEAKGPYFEGDQSLSARVDGIDLIVGGHSHTALKEPIRDATHGTLIVQAGSEMSRVGEVELEIDPETKKVVKSAGRLVDLWVDEIGSDPGVEKAVEKLTQEVGHIYDVVIATAAAALTRNKDGESSLGDWMTDCERSWAKTDLALQNGGGIRADIAAGPVTLRHIFDVMPFDNHVAKLALKGRDVRAMLDHGVGMARMAQISGAEVTYRRKASPGKRVASITVKGKPLADDASYTVATVDFLAQGGDGYTVFEFSQSKEFTKTLLRDVLKLCAQKESLIRPPAAGRLVSLGD